jgi:NADH dehydrogenase
MKRGARARPSGRPRIAIVGGNFAGLTAAQNLGPRYEVTVFDPSPSFEWLPNLHELLSGEKQPADLRLPRGRLVKKAGHRFVRARVRHIDADARRLVTTQGREYEFDACIVAVGGIDETFGVRGVAEHARGFKTVADCARIGRELRALARRRGPCRVVIVGGGFEGIEALGEILRRYRKRSGLHVELIEAGPALMADGPRSIDRRIRKLCASLDVGLRTGSPVVAVTPRNVLLRSGERVRSDLTIWTGGARASPLLAASGLAVKPGSWAPVDATLRSTRAHNVLVIGDAAGLKPPLSKQAYYAMQMGELAAANVERLLAGRSLRPFKPDDKPKLVAFGDLDTFLVAGRSAIASPRLASLKEAVFQLTMAQIDPPLNAPALRQLSGRLDSMLGLALRRSGIRAG